MKEFRVVIPTENYQIVEFRQESLPGIMVLNKALKDFEPKEVFEWHLSVLISFRDLIENGMPSIKEREVVDPYGDLLDSVFKGDDPKKPNALFLARITWNKTRELIYRVFDPEPIHQFLQQQIKDRKHPREFDYRIDPDKDWKLAKWHLGTLKAQPSAGGKAAAPRASA
jgi:hypothetical protein